MTEQFGTLPDYVSYAAQKSLREQEVEVYGNIQRDSSYAHTDAYTSARNCQSPQNYTITTVMTKKLSLNF